MRPPQPVLMALTAFFRARIAPCRRLTPAPSAGTREAMARGGLSRGACGGGAAHAPRWRRGGVGEGRRGAGAEGRWRQPGGEHRGRRRERERTGRARAAAAAATGREPGRG